MQEVVDEALEQRIARLRGEPRAEVWGEARAQVEAIVVAAGRPPAFGMAPLAEACALFEALFVWWEALLCILRGEELDALGSWLERELPRRVVPEARSLPEEVGHNLAARRARGLLAMRWHPLRWVAHVPISVHEARVRGDVPTLLAALSEAGPPGRITSLTLCFEAAHAHPPPGPSSRREEERANHRALLELTQQAKHIGLRGLHIEHAQCSTDIFESILDRLATQAHPLIGRLTGLNLTLLATLTAPQLQTLVLDGCVVRALHPPPPPPAHLADSPFGILRREQWAREDGRWLWPQWSPTRLIIVGGSVLWAPPRRRILFEQPWFSVVRTLELTSNIANPHHISSLCQGLGDAPTLTELILHAGHLADDVALAERYIAALRIALTVHKPVIDALDSLLM